MRLGVGVGRLVDSRPPSDWSDEGGKFAVNAWGGVVAEMDNEDVDEDVANGGSGPSARNRWRNGFVSRRNGFDVMGTSGPRNAAVCATGIGTTSRLR